MTTSAKILDNWTSGNHALDIPTVVIPFDWTIDQLEAFTEANPEIKHVVFDGNFKPQLFEMVTLMSGILVDNDCIVTIRIPAGDAMILAGYNFDNHVMIQLVVECIHPFVNNDRTQIVISSLLEDEAYTIPMPNITRNHYNNKPRIIIPPVVISEDSEDSEDSEE
jgi:hypothetical protein